MSRILTVSIVALALFFGIRFMIGRSDEASSHAPAPGELISTIAVGERVEVAEFVPDQGVAIVEFTADW